MQSVYYRAAGGVVVHAGKILLLDRAVRGEMRLPKGHVEEGESPVQAALREVREEAGYANLEILADLGVQQTRFVDPHKERRVTRDERFFLMRLSDERQIERDLSEHQFTPVWAPLDEAISLLTFDAEREFVRRALEWLRNQ